MRHIVFIHGFLGDPSDWDEVRANVDAPSSVIEIPSVGSWSSTVKEVADALPDDCTLIGYSMGGRLAMGCLVDVPHKVSRLVVVSGNPGIDAREITDRKRHDQSIASQLIRCTTEKSRREFLANWYRQPVFAGLDETQIAQLVEKRLSMNANRMSELVSNLSIANQPNFRSPLQKSETPSLFVAGDRDHKYATLAHELAQLSERISCEIIPDCGHMIPFEQPQQLAESIRRFLPISIKPKGPKGK